MLFAGRTSSLFNLQPKKVINMATLTTDEHFASVVLSIFAADGTTPASVDGVPIWASSDGTIIRVMPNPDGMGGSVETVGPGGPARITVSADADLGAGIVSITGVSEDIMVTPGVPVAATMTLNLGAATPKV